MGITVNTTDITFNDSTSQTTAAATGDFTATFYSSGSGNYDVGTKRTNGLKYIKVTMVGAGGGGGGSTIAPGENWGGRGGYGAVVRMYIPVGPSPTPAIPAPGLIPYSVGTGGTGGLAASSLPGNAGSAGGSTSFFGVTAPGGAGGKASILRSSGFPYAGPSPSMSAAGSSPTPGAASLNNIAPGLVDAYSYTIQNGYLSDGFGVTGVTVGVPVWVELLPGAGYPVNVYPNPSPTGQAGTNGGGYGTGGGGGRTGPTGNSATGGGVGTPGMIFIEEYY
jgi:hypothetical protein